MAQIFSSNEDTCLSDAPSSGNLVLILCEGGESLVQLPMRIYGNRFSRAWKNFMRKKKKKKKILLAAILKKEDTSTLLSRRYFKVGMGPRVPRSERRFGMKNHEKDTPYKPTKEVFPATMRWAEIRLQVSSVRARG